MSHPGDFAYTVKQQADIVRIVGDYVKLRKSGAQNFSGLCPFHKEKSPSFSVHAAKQFYYCFGCHEKGDVFSFVQKVENITFPEAVRLVAGKLGIEVPKASYNSPAEAGEARLRGALIDLHERACQFFEEQLRRPEAAHARQYLAERGLTDETIKTFRIGFAPDSGFVLRDRMKGAFPDEVLRESGLFSWKQDAGEAGAAAMYSKFRNRIMFPIASEQAKVIAFTGRTLEAGEKAGPKYLNSPETPIYSKGRVLYNLDRAKDAVRKLDYAILVEGQMDCIAVYAAGFHNVIASSGTAFTEAQVRLLGRFSKKIVVNFDPDTAGAAAAERSLAMLVAEEFEIKVLTLEQGFDPDLYIRRQGAEAYANALKRSQKYFDYLVDRARAQFPVRTPEGKAKAVAYLLPHIRQVPNRIVRDELAADLAQKLSIDSAVLRQELKHAATTRGTEFRPRLAQQVTDAEKVLIRALAAGSAEEREPRERARLALESDALHHDLPSQNLLAALLQPEPPADPMSLELEEGDRRLLASVLFSEHEELTPELVEGALEALRRRMLERQQREIRARIAEAERRNDTAALARLVQEKLNVDRALAGS